MLTSVQDYHAPQAAASAVAFLNERRLRRRLAPEHQAPDHTAALLRGATKHYGRHVIAWYALGRVVDARAARERIRALERALSRRPSTHLVERERSYSSAIRLVKDPAAGRPRPDQAGAIFWT